MSGSTANFVPAFRNISNISNAQQAVVTFTQAHTYTDGEILSFRVSPPYGMFEMNNKQGTVLTHDSTSVTMDINTLTFNQFTTPGTTVAFPAMAVPAGSGIIPASRPATVNLEDAFDQLPGN